MVSDQMQASTWAELIALDSILGLLKGNRLPQPQDYRYDMNNRETIKTCRVFITVVTAIPLVIGLIGC